MATWVNADGLPIDFGLDEARYGLLAGYRSHGDKRWVELILEVGNLPTGDSTVTVSDKFTLPEGAIIDSVELAPNLGTFAGTGTLDIGLAFDGQTVDDTDGLVDGQTVANLNDGTVTAAGAYVQGAALAEKAYVTITGASAAITGPAVAALRIFYVIPKTGDQTDTLAYSK